MICFWCEIYLILPTIDEPKNWLHNFWLCQTSPFLIVLCLTASWWRSACSAWPGPSALWPSSASPTRSYLTSTLHSRYIDLCYTLHARYIKLCFTLNYMYIDLRYTHPGILNYVTLCIPGILNYVTHYISGLLNYVTYMHSNYELCYKLNSRYIELC